MRVPSRAAEPLGRAQHVRQALRVLHGDDGRAGDARAPWARPLTRPVVPEISTSSCLSELQLPPAKRLGQRHHVPGPGLGAGDRQRPQRLVAHDTRERIGTSARPRQGLQLRAAPPCAARRRSRVMPAADITRRWRPVSDTSRTKP